jgi:hypothetical protein
VDDDDDQHPRPSIHNESNIPVRLLLHPTCKFPNLSSLRYPLSLYTHTPHQHYHHKRITQPHPTLPMSNPTLSLSLSLSGFRVDTLQRFTALNLAILPHNLVGGFFGLRRALGSVPPTALFRPECCFSTLGYASLCSRLLGPPLEYPKTCIYTAPRKISQLV